MADGLLRRFQAEHATTRNVLWAGPGFDRLRAGSRSRRGAEVVSTTAAGDGDRRVAGSAVFAAFSLIVACWVKARERFMGIGQVLTMPLFFASNAIYPIAAMPTPVRWFARINPLS